MLLNLDSLKVGGCPLCPKKTACCVIIYGFSGGSVNPVWKRSVWNRWGYWTSVVVIQQRMLCGVVHRLP